MPGQYFTCEKCDRRFPYTPAMAGKKVRCKCGYVFVPQVHQEIEDPPDEYDLSPDEPAMVKPARTVIEDPQAAPVLTYAHKTPVHPVEEEFEKGQKARNVYFPIALIVLGVGLRVGQMFLPSAAGQSPLVLAGTLIGGLVLNVLLMFFGVIIATQVLGTDLGDMTWAAIKLAAMSIVGGAAASFVVSLDFAHGGIQGPLIALHLLILIYFIGFATFFELDLQEALFTVVIVMFFQTAAFCVAFSQFKV